MQGPIVTGAAPPSTPWEFPRFRNWIAVARTYSLVERELSGSLAPLGIRLPHYDILANIFRFPGLTQQELATRLVVGRSNLSMLLPELEKRDLIVRVTDETDRRVRRLTLTPTGEAVTRQGLAIQAALVERMMQALDAEECDRLGDYMRRIAAHVGAERRTPNPAADSA